MVLVDHFLYLSHLERYMFEKAALLTSLTPVSKSESVDKTFILTPVNS